MSAIAPRGWCPTLFAPMQSGDGLLARVRPPLGRLTAAQARALAAAAARDGNGVIELGNRASVQVRGLAEATLPGFTAAMLAAGLALADPAAEQRRALIVPPLLGDDPGLSRHAEAVAADLLAMLDADARLSALPGKFGCLLDGGGALPLGGVAADVVVRLHGDGCLVAVDGADLSARCKPARAAEAVRALLLAFLNFVESEKPPPLEGGGWGRGETPASPVSASPLPPAPSLKGRGGVRRMRQLVAQVGAKAIFAAARLDGVPSPQFAAVASRTAGWLPYDGPMDARAKPGDDEPPSSPGLTRRSGAFLAGLPFGATDADTLVRLAALTETHADGRLRVTPFRALAFCGVRDADALQRGLTQLGLITDPADPLTRVSACPGQPACASASVPTRADARALARLGGSGTLHVSGCAKGCAHPAVADAVLVGENGLYTLRRHGTAQDPPEHRGLTLVDAAALLRQPESLPA